MILTDMEKAYLAGDGGPGLQRCMRIIVNYAKAFGAERLVKISSAHVIPNIPLELLEQLTEGVKNLPVLTTLHPHMSAFCPSNWAEMGISEKYAADKISDMGKRANIFREKGFNQTYTCYPALVGNLPMKGDYISWIGSGGQVVVNSTIGARCNRDGALMTLASAITGLAPLHGLYLDENRLAEIHVQISGITINQLKKHELSALGYYLGAQAQDHNIVIEGIDKDLRVDYLKQLMVPLTVTGSVGVCHVVGVTPEAYSLKETLGSKSPLKKIVINKDVLSRSLEKFSNYDLVDESYIPQYSPKSIQQTVKVNSCIDMVILGCPHLSIQELRDIALLLKNKRIPEDRYLWLGVADQQYNLAQVMGYADIITASGGHMACGCMATIPDSPIPDGVNQLMTSSMKAAHYVTQLSKNKIKVTVSDIETCILSLLRSE